MCRFLRSLRSLPALRRLHIQYKVYRCPQEVRSIRLGYKRIDRSQSSFRQFQIVGQHDDGEPWPNFLNFSCEDGTIQSAQLVLEHNCIHRSRLQQPQAIGTIRRGDQFISIFLQQGQLSRVALYAK